MRARAASARWRWCRLLGDLRLRAPVLQHPLRRERREPHRFGQAYSKCFRNGGADFSEEDLTARGANRSLIHIDWMIGSNQVDVDGLTAEGRAIPVMRAGEWVD